MKAAGTAGVIGAGFAGDVSASCPSCGEATSSGPDLCNTDPCADSSCEYLSKSQETDGTCYTGDIPEGATLAIIKAGQQCIRDEDLSDGVCVPDGCPGFSHVEFYACASADITVDCANDQATVEVQQTDSVYYEVDYVHCDEPDSSGTLSGSGDRWTTAVPLADCEGTINVWTSDAKNTLLDSTAFDCETATVSVDCVDDVAHVHADDTSSVSYSIAYEDCDADDTSATLDFSNTDDQTVTVADCAGTITLTDDDGRTLGSATFDCETGSVAADCAADEITVSAPDTQDLYYEVDFVDCDASDIGRTAVTGLDSADTVTVLDSIPDCEGEVRLYEDESSSSTLDSATFDCESASVAVDCSNSTATVSASDTDEVWYAIDYANCDEADVSRTSVDLSGSTDSVDVPVAACEGTITVTDDDETVLAETTFQCETASVAVDCPNSVATISAPDTSTVSYAIDYVDCDASDVALSDGQSVDLSGSTDSATVPIAACDGTITVHDDDGRELDSATFDCETASVAVDCANDVIEVTAPETNDLWYEIDYVHCDVGDVGISQVSGLSESSDTGTIDIANCEGTVAIYADDAGETTLATKSFDCETASVSVDCPNSVATVSAPDTSTVFYAIDYQHCDEADVSRTSVDLSGSTDSVDVPVADCEGTITVTDDDGRELDSATFDCETASVSVDCSNSTAAVSASDTDEVWYAIDYANCDEADVSRTGPLDLSGATDTVTVEDIANCEGTITVTDDDETVLAETTFQCETASVTTDCAAGEATISSTDTSEVFYAIDYVDCDASDVALSDGQSVDLSGSTDSATVPIAACDGTITVYDDDGRELDSATFDCETVEDITVDCANDVLEVTAPETNDLWYEIDYAHCDVGDVGRTQVSGLSESSDTGTIDIANCEGTVAIYADESSGTALTTADFDCETASVSVECANDVATISAPDTSTVFYAIDYQHCDEADVSRTSVDLSGSTDSVDVPVADCEGTITVTDDDGRELDSATFDCETASVSVDCVGDTATVTAGDTSSVNYAVDYGNCDAADVSGTLDLSGTDEQTLTIADCEGTITLTDDDGRELDSAAFDCETASVAVDCPNEVATISAADTSTVFYAIDYDDACADDVSRTPVDLGGDTDEGDVSVADCPGTITVTDDDGRTLDSATFDCSPSVSLSATCDDVVADFDANATGDTFSIDVTAGDSSSGEVAGTTSTTETISDASGSDDVVFTYSSDIDGTWDTVEVTVNQVVDGETRFIDERTIDLGTTCGCVDCPTESLEIKFEEYEDEDDEIFEGSTKTQTIDGEDYTFEVVEVLTKREAGIEDSDEPVGVCVESTTHTFCPNCDSDGDGTLDSTCLQFTVKTGEFEETALVARGEAPDFPDSYCFDVTRDEGDDRFTDEEGPIQAISHFTIRCPGAEVDDGGNGGGSGGGNSGGNGGSGKGK